jgi:hypothetical protein
MSMVSIVCPECKTEGKMSLLEGRYEGPYSCWKCHQKLLLVMENNVVTSCTPMTPEEFERQKELKKQRDRMKG